jgi:elongation factor Ts
VNLAARRRTMFTVAQGAVSSYIHNATAPDLGRIGVLVAIEGAGDQAKILELGRKIAMHVAATAPLSLSPDDLDQAAIEKERQIFTAQALESGKPPAVVEKMVEGRIRKFLEEVVLLKQAFVMNPDQTVEQLVAEAGKELGSPLTVKGFVRLALGEGVEKAPEGDFAAEVAAMAGQA